MFDIAFDDCDPVLRDDEDWLGLPCLLVFGEFTEAFVAPIGWWGRTDSERQWLAAAGRLLSDAGSSLFVLEAGRLWWTAWRLGHKVVIQQRLVVSPDMERARRAGPSEVPYDLVGERVHASGEGQPVSEWFVALNDAAAVVNRRAGT